MTKYYPIAAIDIETAKYYKPEEMKNQMLESLYCNNKLRDIVSLSIVSIDENLQIERKTYIYKPRGPIDPNAAKIHGFTDKFFEDNQDLYHHFNKEDALEINTKLKDMKQVFAHN